MSADQIAKDWKWWCESCGTLTNDGECDCTRPRACPEVQRLRRAIGDFNVEDERDTEQAENIAVAMRLLNRAYAELEQLRAENDMMRNLLIDAPTKKERDELFERRFRSTLDE